MVDDQLQNLYGLTLQAGGWVRFGLYFLRHGAGDPSQQRQGMSVEADWDEKKYKNARKINGLSVSL